MNADYKQGYREGFQDGVESERRRQEAEKKPPRVVPEYLPRNLEPRMYNCTECGLGAMTHLCSNPKCPMKTSEQSDYYEYR